MISEDLSLEEYHRSERVSSSKLSVYDKLGPRAYHAMFVARTREREQSEAQLLGCAFEDALLEPKLYAQRYVVRPDGLDGRTKAGKEWYASAGDKPVLRGDQHAAIGHMIENTLRNPFMRAYLETAKRQLSAWCDYPGLPGLQTRPDLADLEGSAATDYEPAVVDIKTCDDLSMFSKRAWNFGYPTQATLCATVLACNDAPAARFYLWAVEKQWPYRTQLFRISNASLVAATRAMLPKLDAIAEHYATDSWPLVASDVEVLEPPRWMRGGEDD